MGTNLVRFLGLNRPGEVSYISRLGRRQGVYPCGMRYTLVSSLQLFVEYLLLYPVTEPLVLSGGKYILGKYTYL